MDNGKTIFMKKRNIVNRNTVHHARTSHAIAENSGIFRYGLVISYFNDSRRSENEDNILASKFQGLKSKVPRYFVRDFTPRLNSIMIRQDFMSKSEATFSWGSLLPEVVYLQELKGVEDGLIVDLVGEITDAVSNFNKFFKLIPELVAASNFCRMLYNK
ncbi:unnamed protein product [Ilex paraguariensis]|uniref:Uncharacterized protein n=1 Tax=Ilex paraguariensis TaxID=185542 RepID=A0ABC8RHC7_9AQUA